MLAVVLEVPGDDIEPLLFMIDNKHLDKVIDASWNHVADPVLTIELDLEVPWLAANFSCSRHVLETQSTLKYDVVREEPS